MATASDQILDSKTVFPHSYREGAKCIGFARPQGHPCKMVIGVAKMREHEHLMMRLNSELEDASQKFQDAAEAAKEAEAARVKEPSWPKDLPRTSGRSGRRLQARDIPSESESDSDSESDGSEDDDVHPLKAWKRYDSKWKAIEKSGLEEGLPVVDQVPWPVASGKHQDVNKEAVATFFNNVADEHDKTGCRAISSHERMRWYSRNV
ncbi:hypothetical protein FOYG_02616 [Fusarium oxysporum NRRL 32931]|uniref:Uncharacterized protein n=1 Tax=Fusarium oxysporum NRRL 32931 TaxID=660029 RepID=W9IT58_FUSOX|nr:hypothetical protein FOYG_02616 [Fusarium oxysporum NRRL 32931]